jgi:hypothetical protein
MSTLQEIEKAQKTLDQWFLGKTSKHYESGNTGAATISDGAGDKGGASYGSYQLSTKMGTLTEYLTATGNYNHAFDGLTQKTPEFDKKWVELANNDAGFHKSQHNFIASKHYEPQKKILADNEFDFSGRGKAVQDMIWSTAVQHRNHTLDRVKRAAKESCLNFSTVTDKQIFEAVQDSKYKHYKEDFKNSSPNWKGLSNRILDEKEALLKLNGYEETINKHLQEVKEQELKKLPDKAKTLENIPAPKVEELPVEQKTNALGDRYSLNTAAEYERILSKPLPVNASLQDMNAYAFAALLSDDPKITSKGLDQVFNSHQGIEGMRLVEQFGIAHEQQQLQLQAQNQAQEVKSPSRSMSM